jgi:hypothetical protein
LRLTAAATTTDSRADQSPEDETTVRGDGGNIVSEPAATARGHGVTDEVVPAASEGQAPEE